MVRSVKGAIWAVNRGVAISDTESLASLVRRSASPSRSSGSFVFGAFAGVGLLLTVLGVSGLIAYTVARQTREIGIRLAIGAQPRDVFRGTFGLGALARARRRSSGSSAAWPRPALSRSSCGTSARPIPDVLARRRDPRRDRADGELRAGPPRPAREPDGGPEVRVAGSPRARRPNLSSRLPPGLEGCEHEPHASLAPEAGRLVRGAGPRGRADLHRLPLGPGRRGAELAGRQAALDALLRRGGWWDDRPVRWGHRAGPRELRAGPACPASLAGPLRPAARLHGRSGARRAGVRDARF